MSETVKPIEIVVMGNRCVYINDYRVAGRKPYVSENLPQQTFRTTLDDVVKALGLNSSKWTDDDQRGLNAAVADAMWFWDDMPMDPDDAISLTGILKDRLQENGFQIVRADQKDKPK